MLPLKQGLRERLGAARQTEISGTHPSHLAPGILAQRFRLILGSLYVHGLSSNMSGHNASPDLPFFCRQKKIVHRAYFRPE